MNILIGATNKEKSHLSSSIGQSVGQRSADPSFNQGVGGSIPALVYVSLNKTLNPELLPVSVYKVHECKSLWKKASAKFNVM